MADHHTYEFIKGTQEHKDKAIALYEKNLAWITDNPILGKVLNNLKEINEDQLPTLVFDENGYGNIQQGNSFLYDDNKKGSEEYYADLKDSEMSISQSPYQYFYILNKTLSDKVENNLHVSARIHCYRLKTEIQKEFESKGINNLEFKWRDLFKNSYYGAIASVSLGYHFKEFMKRRNPAVVTIFDSNIIYLFLSLYCIDYEEIFGHIPHNSFSIVISSTVSTLYANFRYFAVYNSTLSLFRTSFSLFQPDSIINSLIDQINDGYQGMTIKGFFQDEIGMQLNTLFNLKYGARFISNGHPLIDDIPVFIIGSGPSLKNDIEVIKKNKDKALLVACGSSLQAFIANDLTPDIYVWLEKDQIWYERFRNTNYDLSKVLFLSPITTPPYKGIGRISAPYYINNTRLARTVFSGKFKDNISFMRSTVSQIWDPQNKFDMTSEGPTVTNTAYGFMNKIGFTKTYLFGTDLGTKTDQRHSDYLTFDKQPLRRKTDPETTEVFANFGGVVTTMFPYDIGLSTFKITTAGLKQSKPYLKLYNCSDGAYIPGATPLISSEINLPELKRSKEEIIDDIIDFYNVIPQKNALAYWETLYNKEIFIQYKEKVIAFFENDEQDWHARGLYGAVQDIIITKATLLKNLFSGTLIDLILLAEDAYEKVKEEHQAEALIFIRKEMLKDVKTLFDQAELVLETYNSYMRNNQDIDHADYKKILMYRNDVSVFNFDKSGLENPPYSEHNKLFTHDALLDELMIEVNTKIAPKLISSNYGEYTGVGTALNILKNPFRLEFIRIQDKEKLLDIFNKWVKSTADQDLIDKVEEIQQQTQLPTKPVYGDLLFAQKTFDYLISNDESEEFNRHLYAKMRLSLDYDKHLELKNTDIVNDLSTFPERKKLIKLFMDKLPSQDNIYDDLDYYDNREILSYNIGKYRQPVEPEHYRYDQLAQKLTPILIDYMLKVQTDGNKHNTNEINLLDEYYTLLENHVKDETISIYDRATLLGLDLLLCPVVEEKVFDKEINEDILDDDFTKALALTNEILETSVGVNKHIHVHYMFNVPSKVHYDQLQDKVRETITYHRKIMSNWKTEEGIAHKLRIQLQKETQEKENAEKK